MVINALKTVLIGKLGEYLIKMDYISLNVKLLQQPLNGTPIEMKAMDCDYRDIPQNNCSPGRTWVRQRIRRSSEIGVESTLIEESNKMKKGFFSGLTLI